MAKAEGGKMFRKEVMTEIEDFANRDEVIQFLRKADADEYKKIIKIVDVLRQADLDVAIIEAGSKKAYQAEQKDESIADIDELDNLMEDE